MALIPGTRFLLVFSLISGAVVFYMMIKTREGMYLPKVRRLNGLDAIEEAIGRATEMGRPVHFAPGIAGVTDQSAPQTMAAMEILAHTTDLVARYDNEMVVSIRTADLFPIAQEVTRQRFIAAGKPDMFKETTVQFFSSEQFAYSARCMGFITREKVAANIMMGAFWAESLLIAEAGASVGAIQVAGTANLHQIPFLVAACDYTLIGEELYAGGAYLSQDKVKLGSIAGQDYLKVASIALVLLGALAVTFGSDFLPQLLAQ
jgi:hypothetical protein